MSLHRLPLYSLMVHGFHPGVPSVWVKGAGLIFSRGGTEFLFDFLPLLAISQEVVATTIVALHLFTSSPPGLLSTRARTTLALFLLRFFNHLDHLDGPPRRTPFDLRQHPLFLFFEFLGSLFTCLGPVSTTINLQTLGHGDGSFQISLHMGPHVLLQVRLQSR